jgi:hypothetical protein
MKRKHFWALTWIGVPLLVGMGAVVASGYVQGLLNAYAHGDPVLEAASTIDLGPREYGQLVDASFVVANRGASELVLDEFRLSCSCNSLERRKNGEYLRIKSIRLGPKERADLRLRFVARAPVGGEMSTAIHYHSNDPARAQGSILLTIPKVTGGVITSPNPVAFGTVTTGSTPCILVEVRDRAAMPRSIKRVLSSNPELFTARWVARGLPEDRHPSIGDEILLGRIEITLQKQKPGPIDGNVKIFLNEDQRKPDLLPVAGRVAAAVEALPSAIVLPRNSSKGPLYFASCICKSTSGAPLTLQLDEAPPEVSVILSQVRDCPGVQMARIEWKPGVGLSTSQAKKRIVFRARVGDQETTLEIPIQVTSVLSPERTQNK